MREIIALAVLWLGVIIDWTGPFTFTLSFVLTCCALLFLILCFVERFVIDDKIGFRIDHSRLDQPLLPLVSSGHAADRGAAPPPEEEEEPFDAQGNSDLLDELRQQLAPADAPAAPTKPPADAARTDAAPADTTPPPAFTLPKQ